MVRQGEIVEVDFRLPDDSTKKHQALVVSNVIHDAQGDFIYAILISSKNINPQYTIEITPDMLTKPMVKQSYFVTHILDKFPESFITKQNNNFIKPEYFDTVLQKIINSIFGLDMEIEDE